MKKILITTIVTGLLTLGGISYAQTPAALESTPGGEIGGDGNGSFGDGPVVPLDGGLSCVLLSAAVGLGLKQTKKQKLLPAE